MSEKNNCEITVKVTLEEGLQILEKVFEVLKIKNRPKNPEIKWPYWCWNCKLKIEKESDAVKRGDALECPSCGVSIPEP